MPLRQSPDYLILSQAAVAVFAAARLLHFRLQRRFPFLFTYLIVISAFCVVLSVLDEGSKAYFWAYLTENPIALCIAALAVREIFALVFRDYPGLRTAGRWALNVAISISLAIAILSLRTPWPGESLNTRRLFYELAFDRSIHFGLAVIIVILLIFLSRYPLHLDRNTYVASGFFSAMFLAQSIIRFVDTLSPKLTMRYADQSEVAFTALCFLGWGIMMQPASALVPARPPTNKPRETELLQQLESLNSILSRSIRR